MTIFRAPRMHQEDGKSVARLETKPHHLDRNVTRTITLDQLRGAFDAHLQVAVTGRTVVTLD